MQTSIERAWTASLNDLCRRIREGARAAVAAASEAGDLEAVSRAVRQGAGDVTYAIDDVVERAIHGWLDEVAAERPISLLTEDSGWMHRGPGPAGVRCSP